MADQIFEIHDPEIDVEEIMRRIQENIRRRKAAEEGGVQNLGTTGNGLEALEPLALISPPLRARVQEVGNSYDTFTSGSLAPSRTRFKAWKRSLSLRTINFFASWQVQWNAMVAQVLDSLLHTLEGVEGWLQKTREEMRWARSAIEEVQRAMGEAQHEIKWARDAIREAQGTIGETQRGIEWAKGTIGEVQGVVGRVAEGQEGLRRQMEEEGRELRRHLGVLGIRFRGLEGRQQGIRDLAEQLSVQTREAQEEFKRQGELLGSQLKEEGERFRVEARTLREEVADLHQRHIDLARRYEELQQENVLQKRRLDLLLGELRKKAGLDGTSVQRIVTAGEHLLDHTYFLFENHFRGTQEEIRKRQEVYLPVFRDCLTPTSLLLQNGGFVLDLGCGRGEILEILQEAGIPARGVDLNEDMVYLCRQKDLEVVQDDLFTYLRALPAESLAGAISCQVIEHLTLEQNLELLKLLYEKLRWGARLVLETVNPENLLTSSFHFYVDLSHKLKIPAVSLAFLAESLGFTVLETRYLSPYSEELHFRLVEGEDNGSYLHSLNENFHRLNHFFFGPQDYALICCKGQAEDGLGTKNA